MFLQFFVQQSSSSVHWLFFARHDPVGSGEFCVTDGVGVGAGVAGPLFERHTRLAGFPNDSQTPEQQPVFPLP